MKTPKPKIIGYIIVGGGAFMKPDDLGFGRILVPSDSPVQFRERRQARRAIVRTERALAKMKSSLLADWPKLKPLFASLPLEIRPVTAAA